MNKAKRELIELAIKSADERLLSAKFSLSKGFYNDSILISYYAVLDIARAALILVEAFPKSHAGSIHKFSQEFIKKDIFPKKFGKIMSDIEKDRINADYNFKRDFNQKETTDIYADALEFVTIVKKYLLGNIK